MNRTKKIFLFPYLDLLFFSILAVVSEIMSYKMLEFWNSSFYFSFSVVLCLISMIRWGAAGAAVAMIGGIPSILFSPMPFWSGILFYGLSNAFIGIPMMVYGSRNRDTIADGHVFLLLYIFLSHCSLSAGKGIAIFLLTGETTGAKDYFGATFFTLMINIIVCSVLQTRKGLICDMRYYFTDMEGEGYGNGRD
ncbi:hypothetical protein [Lacrimispora sp.]|uniref:hypothetical protein n=1 Tax=Lacrimispora sp. TaxID=2719234 RepID=UPI0028A9D20F|nr:hypothetical protein [Lacrimispora sp.]